MAGGVGAPVAVAALSSAPERTYGTDGEVDAIVAAGDKVVLGGTFSELGLSTGPGVALSRVTGRPVEDLPEVNALRRPAPFHKPQVDAVVADGSGGWYIAGTFDSVGGLARNSIAHIRPNGRVDSRFDARPRDECDCQHPMGALALSGRTLYVGGTFTVIGGKRRPALAALDAVTGRATNWDPKLSDYDRVGALVARRGTIYAAGRFSKAGGKARHGLVALDAASGAATGWDPRPSGSVKALLVSRRAVYVGGRFRSIGGKSRNNIAALDSATGRATAWNPGATGTAVFALATSRGTIYAGGRFRSIGGQARRRLAALNPRTGRATSWNPDPSGDVAALAVSGSTVYVGGTFAAIGGQARRGLAALDAATGAATAWNADTNDRVNVLATDGHAVYVGGRFTFTDGQRRSGLAALDARDGTLSDWDPNPVYPLSIPGEPPFRIYALAASGSTIYVAGLFTSIGGQPRNSLAAVDADTGAATGFTPDPTFRFGVPMAASGAKVYMDLNKFDNSPTLPDKSRIAAFDGATGDQDWFVEVEPWNTIYRSAVSGSTLYVGGSFRTIGGQPRNGLAAIDTSTGTVTDWNPNLAGDTGDRPPVGALAVSGGTVYISGDFSSVDGQPRPGLAALDASTGAVTDWDPQPPPASQPGDEVHMAIAGKLLYVARGSRLFAIDAATGALSDWSPTLSPQDDSGVFALAASGSAVYVGGNFEYMGPLAQHSFAEFIDR